MWPPAPVKLSYESSSPDCARTSSRPLGEKSAVIAVIVSPVTRNSRCLYGRAIFVPVAGMTGSGGRIKSAACVPVTAVTKSTLQLLSEMTQTATHPFLLTHGITCRFWLHQSVQSSL
jgi:hypothetical protein